MSQKLSIVLNLIPDTSSSPHSRTSSVSTDADNDDLFFLSSGEHGEGGGGEGIRRRVRCSSSTSSNSNELHNLAEMFPNYKTQDLSMVLNMANNDMEKAVQILLLDESMLDGVGVVKKTKNKGGTGTEGGEQSNHIEEEGEDFRKDLKDRLVARYGFIDKAQDVKEHRPILPKSVRPTFLGLGPSPKLTLLFFFLLRNQRRCFVTGMVKLFQPKVKNTQKSE